MESEAFRQFALYELQTIALTIFALLYAIKIWQLARLPHPREVSPARGNLPRAIAGSYASVLTPWRIESLHDHWVRWTVFTVYHVGILAAIGATFTIPFLPRLMTEPVRWVFAISIGLAFIGGWLKLAWRLMKPEIRIISTPDDYFSLLVLQVWFFVAIPAILWEPYGWLVTYFVMTALLLIYVPLSKISHYIYWFFSRYFFGVRYGNRGVF
jgi:hypothetical protein